MVRYGLTIICLLIEMAATSFAASYEGTVSEVTPDTITVQQGGIRTQTFIVSNELMTNTVSGFPGSHGPNKLKDVKRGCKVDLEYYNRDGDLVCVAIRRDNPDDAGIITEVGKDTITIRSDNGQTTTYKVEKDLVDNSRDPGRYSTNYPSRFGEAKPGRRIEVIYNKKDGEIIIMTMDVKGEKEHEK